MRKTRPDATPKFPITPFGNRSENAQNVQCDLAPFSPKRDSDLDEKALQVISSSQFDATSNKQADGSSRCHTRTDDAGPVDQALFD
jgi:hypothetical protein